MLRVEIPKFIVNSFGNALANKSVDKNLSTKKNIFSRSSLQRLASPAVRDFRMIVAQSLDRVSNILEQSSKVIREEPDDPDSQIGFNEINLFDGQEPELELAVKRIALGLGDPALIKVYAQTVRETHLINSMQDIDFDDQSSNGIILLGYLPDQESQGSYPKPVDIEKFVTFYREVISGDSSTLSTFLDVISNKDNEFRAILEAAVNSYLESGEDPLDLISPLYDLQETGVDAGSPYVSVILDMISSYAASDQDADVNNIDVIMAHYQSTIDSLPESEEGLFGLSFDYKDLAQQYISAGEGLALANSLASGAFSELDDYDKFRLFARTDGQQGYKDFWQLVIDHFERMKSFPLPKNFKAIEELASPRSKFIAHEILKSGTLERDFLEALYQRAAWNMLQELKDRASGNIKLSSSQLDLLADSATPDEIKESIKRGDTLEAPESILNEIIRAYPDASFTADLLKFWESSDIGSLIHGRERGQLPWLARHCPWLYEDRGDPAIRQKEKYRLLDLHKFAMEIVKRRAVKRDDPVAKVMGGSLAKMFLPFDHSFKPARFENYNDANSPLDMTSVEDDNRETIAAIVNFMHFARAMIRISPKQQEQHTDNLRGVLRRGGRAKRYLSVEDYKELSRIVGDKPPENDGWLNISWRV